MLTVNFLSWILALLPVILILLLMMGFNWGGSKASSLTWLVTQILAVTFFGGSFKLLGYTYVKAFFLSVDVLMILWGAMFLYQMTRKAGTIQVIGKFLSELTENRAFLGIFLGWLFPSFLQGMGGFGVPVAVSAPLLVSAGIAPTLAVIITSIGHGWGVTFGSMGSSFRTMMSVTGLSESYLAPFSAILLGSASLLCGLMVIYLAGGKKKFLSAVPLTVLCSLILFFGEYILATNGLWVISVTVPSMLALIFSFFYQRFFSKYSKNFLASKSKEEIKELLSTLIPYIVLVTLIVIVNFVQPLRTLFDGFEIGFDLPELSTSFGYVTQAGRSKEINPFLHPGTIIFIATIISFILLKRKKYFEGGELKEIAQTTFKRSLNSSIAIFSLVGTAVLMNHVEMTSILALGISKVVNGNIYPLISPFIGALGAFITGSNNNSNVLFANLQLQTAEILKISVPLILAAQTSGGALSSIMAPAKVIIGCSTVGLAGKEGDVIGKLILYTTTLVLIIGILALILSRVVN